MAAIDTLIERAATSPENRLAVVVPPSVHWALPAYELALLTRRRADDSGRRDLAIEVFTPEAAPLAAFGAEGSQAVAKVLRTRRIDLRTSTLVTEREGAAGLLADGAPLGAGAVVALPEIVGPSIEGLPNDDSGFLPVDGHCRVNGVADVYAAGDGTSSPIKQGGLAAQQADAAAEHLAASLGAPVSPQPFEPVLRGELLTGSASLKMLHRLADAEGVGEVSGDHLWWPRKKVAGRYLSAWLAGREPSVGLDPHEMPLEVEVALPDEWHGRPLLENEP
jgi:sulfide:quinone oxidoreductase